MNRPALDAAIAFCSQSGGHWCRASEAGRWAKQLMRSHVVVLFAVFVSANRKGVNP